MPGIILTQNQTFLIGPVAKLLGYIMEGIFFCLDKIGIPNIGLSIILFTIRNISSYDAAYNKAAEIFKIICKDES